MAEAARETGLRVEMLGGLRVTDADGTSKRFRTKKTSHVLAYLALHPEIEHARDALADCFWTEAPADSARQSLRMALSDIRRALGPDSLAPSGRDFVRLGNAVTTDVADFRGQVASAGDELDALSSAIALYRGPLLPEVDEVWAMSQRPSIEEAYAQAVVRFLDLCTDRSEISEGLRLGQTALGVLGCREDIHVGLIRLYSRSGSPSLAIAQFEALERQLEDEWGESPSRAAIEALESAPRGEPESRPKEPTPTSLVGRHEELSALIAILESGTPGRIMTLHGPGGSGKTALAKEALRNGQPRFGVRRWFADLSPRVDPESLYVALHEALGVKARTPDMVRPAVEEALGAGPGILVLDNLEQLIPAISGPVAELAARFEGIRVIATSRRLLLAATEDTIAVGPLALPKDGMSIEELRSVPAVELFVMRARTANRNFALTSDNAKAVVALCRSLDGLPLALELAASRVVTHTVAQVLSEVASSPGFLQTRHQGVSERQRSLSATLAWSLDILSRDDARVFVELGLFRSSFTASDAMAVAGTAADDATLAELVDSSLVHVDVSGEMARMSMLETVREFARERLGDDAGASERYVNWARRLFRSIMDARRGLADITVFDALNRYDQDLIFAAKLASEGAVDVETAADFLVSLEPWVEARSHQAQILPSVRRLYENPQLTGVARARVGIALVHALANIASMKELRPIVDEALELMRGFDDPHVLAETLYTSGWYRKVVAEYELALEDLRQAVRVFESLGDDYGAARSTYEVARTLSCIGDHPAALTAILDAQPMARRSGDATILTRILFDSGSQLARVNRSDEALVLLAEALVLSHQIGNVRLEGMARWQEGDVYRVRGEAQASYHSLSESVRLMHECGFDAALKWIGLTIASMLTVHGDHGLAVQFVSLLVRIRDSEGRPLGEYEREEAGAVLDAAAPVLGAVGLAREKAAGESSDWPKLLEAMHESMARSG